MRVCIETFRSTNVIAEHSVKEECSMNLSTKCGWSASRFGRFVLRERREPQSRFMFFSEDNVKICLFE
jgi:hypothetical protein